MGFKKISLCLLMIASAFLACSGALPSALPAAVRVTPLPGQQMITLSATPKPEQTAPKPTPESEKAPLPAPPSDPVKALIAGMSPRQLIGQMVMIGFAGTSDMSSEAKNMMRQYEIGNIIFFGQNVSTFGQAKKLIDAVKACNANPKIPLTICIDIEGGNVTRFRGQWRPFISGAATLGKANDKERVFRQYTQIGATLKDMGFNLDLAPVADMAPNPAATFLGARMFGSSPEKVSPLVREAVKGLHEGGVASLIKHFPGHGETAADSHHSLPVIGSTGERLESYALAPFKAAIDAGADAVLVAHLLLPNIDKEIASVSYIIITEILREKLGFNGVVLSDDMRMAGITRSYSSGEAAVRFVEAGGDIVLIGKQTERQYDVLRSLNAAYQSGRLTRARLEESAERVLRMKQQWCALKLWP